ncbi:MAG: hypothetical protein KAI66_14305 [Lentisphaeria bacterium]|nr:hypothetical protein [Lentisphaeria bacterium]
MKTATVWTAFGVLCLGMLVFSTGCQTLGKSATDQDCAVCPGCNMQTQTAAIKDVKYSKCVCPACKAVSKVDPLLADALQSYVGAGVGGTVQVCTHCKTIVCKCPACRKK